LGYGYQKKPRIVFATPTDSTGHLAEGDTLISKTEAKLTPYIVNGFIRGVTVEDGGVGYTNATITINSGSGVDAKLTPIFAAGDLSTIQAQIELLATAGTLSSVHIEDGGTSITSIAATVIGDGTGATVNPVIEGGVLTKLLVTNSGANYTYASISIVLNSDATVPTTRAILSPFKGHAANPLQEFYAKSIALYAAFSNERNLGFDFRNTFRQVMIYKNPLDFTDTSPFESAIGSSCYNITTITSGTDIELNTIVTNSRTGSLHRVTDFDSSNVLLQPLGAYDVSLNDQLSFTTNGVDYNIIVSQITPPTFDKYSGEILYIDNIAAIAPNENQVISINTVINLK
jgi:hypothetical protein